MKAARTKKAQGLSTGLNDRKIECILGILLESSGADSCIDQVILFGSRARGNWREGSDIDLAITGSNLSCEDVWRWNDALEEALFPWTSDIILIGPQTSTDLIDHIKRVGVVLYDRRNPGLPRENRPLEDPSM